MKLTPEQISFLRKEIPQLRIKTKDYNRYDFEKNDMDSIETQQNNIKKGYQEKLEKYQNLLITSEYVRTASTEFIEIGTKFGILYDDTDYEEYILVEEAIGNHKIGETMEVGSPIGKSILGKKERESFSYTVGTGKNRRTIKGIIAEIKKDEFDYKSYIRNIEKDDEQEEIPTIITESQKELLEIEIKRLLIIITNNSKEKDVISKRIEKIKKILATSQVIATPDSDKITIGTTFDLTLIKEGKEVTRRLELIDKAVSDELTDDYVEKNSLIGTAIYGRSEQESFIISTENCDILCVVFNIRNSASLEKTLDERNFQKNIGNLE